jgi:hypothetical protein
MEKQRTPLQLEIVEKETRGFTCPHCNTHLQFRVNVAVVGVQETLTREEGAVRDESPLKVSKQTLEKYALNGKYDGFLDTAKNLGVFDAFNQALEATPHSIPKDRELYFLKWFEKASRIKTHSYALRQCLQEKDLIAVGDLELWGFQNVCAVLADGVFKVFLPTELTNGKAIEKLVPTEKGFQLQKQTDLTIWVRTRFGYIERSGEFCNELRKHSIGSFQL